MKRTRYQSLTIKRKLKILERVEHLPPPHKKKDIAAEFGIPQSTLSTILKNKDSLQANDVAGEKKKRVRNPTKLDSGWLMILHKLTIMRTHFTTWMNPSRNHKKIHLRIWK